MTTCTATESTLIESKSNIVARYAQPAARILFGLGFFVFGLNGFLGFIPPPAKPMPQSAMALAGALMNSGYLMQLVAGPQLVVGALLLANRFVPLALVLLAPVVVNILAFHVFLERSGLPVAIVVTAMELYLAWTYRSTYRALFRARSEPSHALA